MSVSMVIILNRYINYFPRKCYSNIFIKYLFSNILFGCNDYFLRQQTRFKDIKKLLLRQISGRLNDFFFYRTKMKNENFFLI